jgi:hypothetical protein
VRITAPGHESATALWCVERPLRAILRRCSGTLRIRGLAADEAALVMRSDSQLPVASIAGPADELELALAPGRYDVIHQKAQLPKVRGVGVEVTAGKAGVVHLAQIEDTLLRLRLPEPPQKEWEVIWTAGDGLQSWDMFTMFGAGLLEQRGPDHVGTVCRSGPCTVRARSGSNRYAITLDVVLGRDQISELQPLTGALRIRLPSKPAMVETWLIPRHALGWHVVTPNCQPEADGTYLVDHVPPGEYLLFATVPATERALLTRYGGVPVVVQADRETRVSLTTGGELAVGVQTAEARPARGRLRIFERHSQHTMADRRNGSSFYVPAEPVWLPITDGKATFRDVRAGFAEFEFEDECGSLHRGLAPVDPAQVTTLRIVD